MTVTANESLQGSYVPDWARAANTTLIHTFKDVPKLMLRASAVLAMIEHHGNTETNVSGRGWQREVQYRLHNMRTNVGNAPVDFAPTNLWRRISLEERGYTITDSITKVDELTNRGEDAIVPLVKGMVKRLDQSARERMADEVFKDGDAAGNDGWHGYNSFTGHVLDTATQSIDQSSAGAPSTSGYVDRDVNTLDFAINPSDTYCGLATDLGAYSGTQITGIWPYGRCNEWMDFNTPVLLNTNTTFPGIGPIGSGQTGWQTNCVELLALGVDIAARNLLRKPLDLAVMPTELFTQLKNALRSKERANITSNDSQLRAYGFPDANTIKIDGLEISVDYYAANVDTVRTDGAAATSVPAIYGFCTGAWHLISAFEGIFEFDKPFYDIDTGTTKFRGDAWGNFWNSSVRSSVLWAAYSPTS